MTGHVYCRDGIAQEGLEKLLRDLTGRLSFVIRQTEAAIAFEKFEPGVEFWDEGQAFSPTLEVRWKSQPNGYEVMLLTETPHEAPVEGWRKHEPGFDVRDCKVYLWGRHWNYLAADVAKEKRPQGWAQARIAADLNYPMEAREWAFVKAREYRRAGITFFTRLMALEGEDGK
jgi:hypothetical protein